jgi:hypothetical protein
MVYQVQIISLLKCTNLLVQNEIYSITLRLLWYETIINKCSGKALKERTFKVTFTSFVMHVTITIYASFYSPSP